MVRSAFGHHLQGRSVQGARPAFAKFQNLISGFLFLQVQLHIHQHLLQRVGLIKEPTGFIQ